MTLQERLGYNDYSFTGYEEWGFPLWGGAYYSLFPSENGPDHQWIVDNGAKLMKIESIIQVRTTYICLCKQFLLIDLKRLAV